MVAMVVCRQKASGQCTTVEDKLYKIVQLICFSLEPNRVQRSEVEYVSHLLGQWVEVTTGYKMSEPAVLKKVLGVLYRDHELAYIDDVVKALKVLPELIALFEIYQKEKQPVSVKTDESRKPESHPTDGAVSKALENKAALKHVTMKDVTEEPAVTTAKQEAQKADEHAKRQLENRLEENLNQLHWNT